MKLTVLGCNGPYPAAGGACSGYLLQTAGANILLDCGAGVLSRLTAVLPPEQLSAVVLSHLHYDHMSDMLPLIYRLSGRETRLPVYAPAAPAPVRALLESVFDLRDIALGGQIGDVTFTALPVRHPVPCFAARFECAGKALVYTGDTNTCEGLSAFAAGCGLLLIDACFSEALWAENKPHLSARLAAETAMQAQAKQLVLTHFTPGIDQEQLLKEAQAVCPRAVLARAGLALEV